MSADNGIYVLKTGVCGKTEYRVSHLQAVENVYWDYEHCEESDNPDIWIANARKMWDSSVFLSREEAWDEAIRQYDEIISSGYLVLEYGISEIYIPRNF